MLIALGVVFVILFCVIWMLQERYYISQYLFFCRYPILVAAVIFVVPIVAIVNETPGLTNLFSLSFGGLITVLILAGIATWVAIFTARLIWVTVEGRNGLPFQKARKVEGKSTEARAADATLEASTTELPSEPRACWPHGPWLHLFLLLPVVFATWKYREIGAVMFSVATVVGVLVPVCARLGLISWFRKKHESVDSIPATEPTLASPAFTPSARFSRRANVLDLRYQINRVAEFLSQMWKDLGSANEHVAGLQKLAFWCFIGTAILYLLLGWFLNPGRHPDVTASVPALACLFVLLTSWCWILAVVSFLFDKTRVPVIGVAVLMFIPYQGCIDTDHYYVPRDTENKAEVTVAQALKSWRDKNPNHDPMVVITASGGGIRAAMWTTVVLRGLEQAIPGFGKHVAMISSVSGGSVGSMYYVNGYTEESPPSGQDLDRYVAWSGSSSLGAVVWGFAYPDFWRPLVGGLISDRDRGWAQEQMWKRFWKNQDPNLSGWRQGVLDGWRPLMVFNATLEETGERFLLSPASLSIKNHDTKRKRRGLGSQLREGATLSVTTAARLSATFPYVSPLARPPADWLKKDAKAFHVADGGYFDNYGVMTALELLQDYLKETEPEERPPRVILVQIRASASIKEKTADAGFIHSVVGPLAILENVRASTQLARNSRDVNGTRSLLKLEGVKLECFAFDLGPAGPLSWHLSKIEKEQIAATWPTEEDIRAPKSENENARQVIKLKTSLGVN